ncbi:TIGR00341 family protein [Fodinibius salsisoli]|uniref:TIGR00341 family protein n=1 Tax=Fodinibius salsisoli TaxID=2820877 RepID=A0ABT3PJ01_9BACT|nr:TIGR00341 family protein [Fodinibius salsisoli]MCW9705921.1 TIGR00341 family protein [Fodinibius salsisoli]
MNLRMMELIAPPDTAQQAREIVEDQNVIGIWTDDLEDGYAVLRVLLDVEQTETVSDTLSEKFGNVDGFRIMLFSVEATLPQPDNEEQNNNSKEEADEKQGPGRVSREELYADVTGGSELTPVYLAMVILSTLVAGVGLLLDDVATIIGAMVIAPLLGPNVSLALAATLGDTDLGWRSLKANAAGLLVSLAVAFMMGLMFTVNPESEELISRTMVNLKHIIIALAAGSAGVLAFTRGVPATIVGVMVAVALLPPLVDVGLLLGAGYMQLAIGAGILTITNLICINLAGISTFLIQGVRPRSWWEEKKAKKASRIALVTWFVLLVVFASIIWYWGQFDVEAMIP